MMMPTYKLTKTIILLVIIFLDAPYTFAQQQTYSGHGAKSVSPETLAKFSPPPLDPQFSRYIQSMLDIRSPGLGRVSHKGKRLYFSWSITGIPQIWRLDGPKRFPIQMTGGEDATSIEAVIADGKYLVLSRDRKGEENPGLYLQDANGGPLIPIQHKENVQTFYQFTSKDQKFIYFTANDIKPDSRAIYRYNLENKTKELVFSQDGIWYISDHKKDNTLLLVKATGALSREYDEWNPKTKILTPLFGQGEKEEYSAEYGARPGELIVLTPKFGEFRRLYQWRNSKFTPVTPEMKRDIDGFSVDHPKKHILLTINEGGYTRLEALDARTFKKIEIPHFPDAEHVFFGSTTKNGRYTTLGIVTAKAPRTNYVYDWKKKKLTQWVIPAHPEIDTTPFVPAVLEYYPARDGTPIPMFVRRPSHCKEASFPCPVVVDFHGGPEGQSTPGFNTFSQMFIEQGFIYVEPNVRGSEGYGKTWSFSDNGPKRLNVITDIEDCSTFIKSHWKKNEIEPKVGITGGSYGGYSTLIGMTMFSGSYDAGVAIVGMSNLITFLQNPAPYRRILRITEYGDPEKDKEVLQKLSPITYIDKVKSPLMIIQGASDPRVPVGEAIQFQEALQAKKIPSKLIVFSDEGHGAQKRDNRVFEIGHTLQFFKTHLK